VGRLVDVEMQLLLPEHFRVRILYYWAALYGKQLGESDRYSLLRPAISICFVNQTLFPGVKDYHLSFGLFDRIHDLCFSDHIQVHLLELPKFGRRLEELRSPEEIWLYFLRHIATMDADNLPAPLNEPVYRKATKELEMLTTDARDRERYEARQKAFRDHMSLIEESTEKAREEGRQEGRQEGELIGRIHLCQRLLKQPLTPREELATLPVEELRRRVDSLEARVIRS